MPACDCMSVNVLLHTTRHLELQTHRTTRILIFIFPWAVSKTILVHKRMFKVIYQNMRNIFHNATMHWFLPPTNKLGQGYVFTHVCDSVHRGSLPQCMLGYPPGADTPTPGADTPTPGADTPWSKTSPRSRPPKSSHPPGADTPRSSACWEIRTTSGRYASYWNVYLLKYFFWNIHPNT